MSAPLSSQEQQYYDRLFDAVNKDDTGVLPGSDALPFLTASGLPQQILGEIWAIADPDNNGFLTKDGFYKVTRLIGWIQSTGQSQVDPALASKAGPLPKFNGYPGPAAANSTHALSPTATGGSLPPLTPADRTKFTRIFVGCGPANGLVTGEKARNVFLKSQLPYDKLAQIWQLADTQDRGALDLTDFIIGMHLIQSCMANSALNLPATLPPGLYEVASNGRPQPNAVRTIRPTSPMQAQSTGPLQRQTTGTLQPQMTGQSFTAAASTPPRSSNMTPTRQTSTAGPYNAYNVGGHNRAGSGFAEPWDVSPDAKATSDRFFAQLDPQNKGVVEGDVAVPFMLQSQLDETTLASIWDLADIRQEGKLDRDEFAVAMHLINAKLAGQDVPGSLPNSLIPPSLRGSLPSGQPESSQPSAATKDLFDLFNDSNEAAPSAASAVAPTAATAPFLPQPPSRRGTGSAPSRQLSATRATQGTESFAEAFAPTAQPAGDLLGDDSTSSVPDKSADIGNMKLQLENTNRGLSQLEQSKAELERQDSGNASDLQTLERELSSARTKHEAETKAVSDLRVRVGEQTAKLKQLRADVISAESDLNAMRMEKDELEQAFLRDKEEVRGLQKQIKELEDEKTGLKLLLDKVRKEARQQRGLVSITKKQVSTAEAGRDAAQSEVRDAETAAQDPEGIEQSRASPTSLPTPKALSPNATGASQRSLNPFERFRTSSADASTSLLAAGGAGAIAGAALGGASITASPAAGAESPSSLGPTVATGPTMVSPQEEDPFGMPAINSATQPEAGFDDSFGQHTPAIETQPATDFDSAFADFDADIPSAAPQVNSFATEAIGPGLNADHAAARLEVERAASTQAVPPSSQRSTPQLAEHVMGGQSGAVDSVLPEPREQFGSKQLDTGELESSDDDERPEDVGGSRRMYSADEQYDSQRGVRRSDSLNAEGEHNAARVRRHAPPPPTGRQSSRSEQVTSPGSADSGAPAAPSAPATAIDPFGVPVDSALERSSPIASLPLSDPRADFGESFDPLTSTTGNPANVAPVVPGAFPGTTSSRQPMDDDIAHKASEFDDENDFDFSDIPPTSEAVDLPASALSTVATPLPQPEVPQSLGSEEPAHSQRPPEPFTQNHLQQSQPPQQHQPSQPQLSPQQTQQQQQPPPSNAFDDEFANFDDDFGDLPSQTNSGSDNNSSLLRSYEVVSPVKSNAGQQESTAAAAAGTGGLDEWGIPASTSAPDQSAALSFDDAFGGDFAPQSQPPLANAPLPPSEAVPTPTPPIPARPSPPSARPSNDVPQADDLEDVKRLCGMGFPRSLVVEALDANGYDFQKALNVLLVK